MDFIFPFSTDLKEAHKIFVIAFNYLIIILEL